MWPWQLIHIETIINALFSEKTPTYSGEDERCARIKEAQPTSP